MATTTDQRSRRTQSKASAESWADTPTTPQKEAPEPAETIAKGKVGKAPMPFSLLSSLPSPARNIARSQPGPCGPPTYAPTTLVTPSVPPPPMMPAPACQAPNMMNMAIPEQPQLGSYRDRLRAGGAGAFQRAFQSGLVPKAMKQDWSTGLGYTAQMQGQGYNMPQESQIPNGTGTQYSMVGDSQQAWYGAGQAPGPDCLGILMNQSQMPPPQQQQLQQNSQIVQQMPAQSPMQYFQVPQPQPLMQMGSFTDGEQGQMQIASMQMSSMHLPQMPMAEMQESTPTMSGDSTPSEYGRCMSITEQGVPEDLDAYLKAAAAANDGYED